MKHAKRAILATSHPKADSNDRKILEKRIKSTAIEQVRAKTTHRHGV
jgi:hypothetical protein